MKKEINKLIYITSFFIFVSLCADVEEHLKKIGSCTDHRFQNIDCVYLINLEERPEKFCSCMQQLVPYGILPHRVSAVNGWKLSIEALNELGVKYGPWMQSNGIGSYYAQESGYTPQYETMEVVGRTYFGHRVFPGAIGVVLSHLSVLQHADNNDFETIWVMEDDIEILKDPCLLPLLIDRLDQLVGKEGWDILFTDRDTKGPDGQVVLCHSHAWRPNFTPKDPQKFGQIKEISPEFRQIGARYGSYSMIFRRSGIKKLLQFIKQHQIFLPFDMEYTLPHDMRLFTVLEDIVTTQYAAPSDNTAANYVDKE